MSLYIMFITFRENAHCPTVQTNDGGNRYWEITACQDVVKRAVLHNCRLLRQWLKLARQLDRR
jgi:hypothetical protein